MAAAHTPATLKDIAALAGVSLATVSRVMGDADYPVREKTRAKVLAAAEQLGYTPNLLGRYFKTGHSDDIGVLVPNLSNPLFVSALRKIEEVLTARRYNVLICSSERSREKENLILNNFLAKKVCGIILIDIEGHEDLLKTISERGIRLAALDGEEPANVTMLRCGTDLKACGYIAADHLLERGLKKIAYFSSPLDKSSRRLLLEGYRERLREEGITPDDGLIYIADTEQNDKESFEYSNGLHMAERLVAEGNVPEAILTGNDMAAVGAMRALRGAGYRVPEDVAVMGCDNTLMSLAAELSSVEIGYGKMGEMLAEALVERIEGRRSSVDAACAPYVIRRSSTEVDKNSK